MNQKSIYLNTIITSYQRAVNLMLEHLAIKENHAEEVVFALSSEYCEWYPSTNIVITEAQLTFDANKIELRQFGIKKISILPCHAQHPVIVF